MKSATMRAITFLLSLNLIGCGDFQSSGKKSQSSNLFSPSEPSPVIDDGESVPDGLPETTPTQITGPTHVPRGKCSSAIRIQLLSNPNGPQIISVPENLKGKIFLDQNCSGPSLLTKQLRTNRLPLQIFFRSPVLSEETLTLDVNGAQSNSLTILSYKEQFATATFATIGSSLQINNNHGSDARYFELSRLSVTDSSATSPAFTERKYNDANIASGLVLASQSGNQYFAFDKTNVHYDAIRIAAKATALAYAESTTGPGQACYSTPQDVFCLNTSNTVGGFQPVALPAGTILDLTGRALGLVCAVKAGTVLCWGPDRTVTTMNLGTENLGVVITSSRAPTVDQSEVCALRINGRVGCARNNTPRDIAFQNITRITAGPMDSFIAAEGEVMGVKFGEVRGTGNATFRPAGLL